MLVFHSAYTYDFLRDHGLEIFVESRDAGNFFNEVLTVSPIANLQYTETDLRNFTGPELFTLDSKNLIIEGKISRFRSLKGFPLLDFLIAQVLLLFAIIKHGNLHEVELVRAEDPRLNGLYGFLFSRLLRKPLVIGVWGNPGRLRDLNKRPIMPRLFPSIKSEERLEKFILRRAHTVLAQNQENLGYALGFGVESKKTYLTELSIGIHKSHFLDSKSRMNVEPDFRKWDALNSVVLVCISRLELLKNIDCTIKACENLEEAGLDFKLILIGDGRELENLKLLAKERGLADRVIFAGNRTQEWIAGALNFADINLAPLCGRSLLEASLGGVPTIAFDVDWHSEIVIPGVTGILVPDLDFSAMEAAILQLSEDSQLRIKMGTNVHDKAISLASPEEIARKQFAVYRNLVRKPV